jgi:predicted DNA-binding transcriptional regulator YafY
MSKDRSLRTAVLEYIDKVITKPKVLNIRYINPSDNHLIFVWFRQLIVL